jgi:hypothetical protein
MTARATPEAGCPTDVLEWIPWYGDDGLSEAQRGAIEAHAADCARCRDELALVTGESAVDAEALPAADGVYERVLARIADDSADRDAVERSNTPPATPPARRRWIRARWHEVAAVAGVAAGIGLAFGWFSGRGFAEPVYVTAAAPPAARGGTLSVIFRDDVTARQIEDALRALGADVVAGPDGSDVMRLRLPRASDPVAAARMLRAEGTGIAAFAEPSVGGGHAGR